MNASIEEAQRLMDRAKVQRKRGDALRKAGREEPAKTAFVEGVELLTEAAQKLESLGAEQVAEDLAESLGAKGGMLRRVGAERQDEALQAYEDGARVEQEHDLSSTYNRLNAIKFSLLTGERLSALKPRIDALAKLIEEKLRTDSQLSDSGWAWADLGDCQALLGNMSAARSAYTTFIDKAEIKSPKTTLAVLNELALSMAESEDPDADRVRNGAETLQMELGGEEVSE